MQNFFYSVQGGSEFWLRVKSLSVTIQMKVIVIVQYFPVVLSVVLY